MIERFAVGVAIDGSAASSAAVRWAAVEAARNGGRLKVIHVCEVNSAYLWAIPDLPEQLQELSRPTVSEAVRLARQTEPGIEVTDWTLVGPAVRMLLLASEYADLIVLGRSGRSSLAAHMVGSTTYRMAAHAHCPVVAIPEPATDETGPREPRRVIVGIADRPTRGHAIDFAIAEADRHGADLLAVKAWSGLGGPGTEPALRESEELDQVNQLLATHLARHSPDLPAATMLRAGSPSSVLSGLCRPDDLLVLGQHRHGPFVPPSIRKVVADCLHHAACPVAVVPEPAVTAEQHERPRVSEATGVVSY
ncbi:MAG TPA: universal stress protein [Jatrophihabitans sp.]|nr:universal stress protein [Jatrophihabitans sp.]